MSMHWKRKRDGVLITTETRLSYMYARDSVLCRRVDNGHSFWATWAGLNRKYELVHATHAVVGSTPEGHTNG